MKTTLPTALPLILLALLLGSATALADVRSLVQNSPFVPADFNVRPPDPPPPPAQNPLENYELRGIMYLNGEYIFSVYDPQNRQGRWLSESQMEDGLEVSEYDLQRNQIVLRRGSHTKRLELKEATIATLEVRQQPATGGGPQRPGQPQRERASDAEDLSDEEVRERMQRIAEEIRRRRAIRRSIIEEGSEAQQQQQQQIQAPQQR